ncbi:ABC-three component system protein [Xanthomonas nasturtii]|uniref:ABC-three component system protein n=1 Tax=Xanthomonas nasturtii TaxID=1843581 RepID=UPI002B23003C|nr:ABC-three component system protein [Xanthomonas nasturtii]MEA9578694.1 ABC-three component system protein [Xanthomonas nasturtii]
MIVSIESSLTSFKAVKFHSGLNVLLSDRTSDSTNKQTRNSAGKTSLIEVIHFLLGADCEKDSLFRLEELIEHTFKGTFRIGGELLTIARTGSDPSKIFLISGGEESKDIPRKLDKASERLYVSNVNWRVFLGHAMFGLPADERGTLFDESFTPTFRSMFSYFVRRRNSGGFISPERQAEKQQRWDWQVNLSYLFGLDWQIPFAFNKIRAREKTLEELKKAVKIGALGSVIGTVAELRPQVTIAEAKASKLRQNLEQFEVLDSYKSLSKRAGQIKTEMQTLTRQSVTLNETLDHLQEALHSERPPQRSDIQQLFAAAGVELPGVALRRFDDVSNFYESVVANRRVHLEDEISDVRSRIEGVERGLSRLDDERSSILRTLQGRGALDDFLAMQRDLADVEANAASLRERFKAAEALEGETTKLDIDRAELKRKLQEDHHIREKVLDEAILIIADAIAELYDDRTGRLVVAATENGPEFRISIEGDRGGGIANMEIFCFDLALLQIVTKRYGGPGFLIHDSHLFDGVDERQVAGALRLGKETSEELQQQYIVTMNSDIFDRLPADESTDLHGAVLDTRLSDHTEDGGLFGFRFG